MHIMCAIIIIFVQRFEPRGRRFTNLNFYHYDDFLNMNNLIFSFISFGRGWGSMLFNHFRVLSNFLYYRVPLLGVRLLI